MIIETEDYTTWITEKGTENGIPFFEYENTDGKNGESMECVMHVGCVKMAQSLM